MRSQHVTNTTRSMTYSSKLQTHNSLIHLYVCVCVCVWVCVSDSASKVCIQSMHQICPNDTIIPALASTCSQFLSDLFSGCLSSRIRSI